MSFEYVLSVMSNDHPGIVAGVSSAVERLGGNINSCSQTVLNGYFTFITLVELPREYTSDELVEEVRYSEGLGPDYQVIARRCDPRDRETRPGKTGDADLFVITAFGKDRPGIVKQFSRYLAGHDINIIDLYGYRSGDDFILIGQLTIPSRVNIGSLQDDLEETGLEYGFTVRLQHNNIFVATNQIRLTEIAEMQ